MKNTSQIKCEKCGEVLDPQKAKWLELSETDGNYYATIPDGHVSQGAFSFGTKCATEQLRITVDAITRANETHVENRGGKREGSGRPKGKPTKTLAYRVPLKQAKRIDREIRKVIGQIVA
jgi:hypothetical protein